MQGELCTALAINNPSRANFVPHTRWMRSQSTQPHTKCHRCGGCRSIRRACLRCPWAMAGPGRASSRRAKPHISNQAPLVWKAPEGSEGTGGLRGAAPNEVRPPSLASGGTRLRCPWSAAGSGCGARGRWRGPAAVPVGGGRARAGLEIDHSEPQARVWRSRGRAAAHRHTQRQGPTKHHNGAPGTPAAPQATQQQAPPQQRPGIQKTDIRIGCRPVVELGGFEPPTFSLRTRRATNCAIAPRTRTA